MPIEGFDYKAFANDLASQAGQILMQQSNAAPDDISAAEKKTIVETLRRFCLMAGEALSNDPQIKLNAQQASIITQFIGEWTFHKSIDLINSKIPAANREPILQIVAANIFNTAKLAIIKNLPQEQLISLVEAKVKQVYNAELEKLVKMGVLSQEECRQAANQSNLNDMVEKTAEAEKLKEAADAAKGADGAPAQESSRLLKFAALALVLKKLDEKRAQEILSSLDKQDAKHVSNYMKMSNFESKIDPAVMMKSLNEIKKLIPSSGKINTDRILNRFHRIVKEAPPEVLSAIAVNERENIRDFILDINFPAEEVFSPYVISSAAKTIEDQINDN